MVENYFATKYFAVIVKDFTKCILIKTFQIRQQWSD